MSTQNTSQLVVWMHGRRVGQWIQPAKGPAEFGYDPDWLGFPLAQPISLSLPFTSDNKPHTGAVVTRFFDNLLPDSTSIRARLKARYQAAGTRAFDLLWSNGGDSAGALQLLPEGRSPDCSTRVDVTPLDEPQIASLLRSEVIGTAEAKGRNLEPGVPVVLAGAQEKTAFTRHQGQWCLPHGSTPTTHIFKLPMGLVGNRQADMRTSVENEWLCAQLLNGFGLPVAACEMAQFEEQKVLIAERFDRLWQNGQWLRLHQEDFCQATGNPPEAKYESDGGPGLTVMARVLQDSETAAADLKTLLTAQLLFWMLAATDGHAKNFSLSLLPGGKYRLTPLYDILSAWPITGAGPNMLDVEKLRLALAVRGKNTHYRIRDIQRRHFNSMAQRCGLPLGMDTLIDEVLVKVPHVLESVSQALPKAFPQDLFDVVAAGLQASAKRLTL